MVLSTTVNIANAMQKGKVKFRATEAEVEAFLREHPFVTVSMTCRPAAREQVSMRLHYQVSKMKPVDVGFEVRVAPEWVYRQYQLNVSQALTSFIDWDAILEAAKVIS